MRNEVFAQQRDTFRIEPIILYSRLSPKPSFVTIFFFSETFGYMASKATLLSFSSFLSFSV